MNLSPEIMLAKILRITEKEVKEALFLTNKYKIVKRKKKSGGCRVLYIPPPALKSVQKKIHRLFVRLYWYYHWNYQGIYGIFPKTSYIDHAQMHKDSKWILQVDLKDAFPSTDIRVLEKIIYSLFIRQIEVFEKNFNISRKLFGAELYKKLSKKLSDSELVFYPLREYLIRRESNSLRPWVFPQKKKLAEELANLIIKLTTYQGTLPQGTPTAPILFHLFIAEGGMLNKIISLFSPPKNCQDKYRFRVSIYVDNIVISAQKPIPKEFRKQLFKIIKKCGFKENPNKTRHQGIRHGLPLITGLRVGNGRVALPRRKLRQIRGIIYRAKFNPQLKQKVEGFKAFLKPIYGNELPSQLKGLFNGSGSS